MNFNPNFPANGGVEGSNFPRPPPPQIGGDNLVQSHNAAAVGPGLSLIRIDWNSRKTYIYSGPQLEIGAEIPHDPSYWTMLMDNVEVWQLETVGVVAAESETYTGFHSPAAAQIIFDYVGSCVEELIDGNDVVMSTDGLIGGNDLGSGLIRGDGDPRMCEVCCVDDLCQRIGGLHCGHE